MKVISLLISALIAVSGPVMAQEASPPVADAASQPSTANLVNCAIARNAGDVRWIIAVNDKQAKLNPELAKGARINALSSVLYGCPIDGADIKAAFGMIARGMQFHAGSENAPRRMDRLADCIAKVAPAAALAYLEAEDRASTVNLKFGLSDTDLSAIFSAAPSCGAELTRLSNNVQSNELYSRLNWLIRAMPTFAALSQSLQPVGQ